MTIFFWCPNFRIYLSFSSPFLHKKDSFKCKDPDQTLHSVTFDVSLHCSLRLLSGNAKQNHKNSKDSDSQNICCTHSKIKTRWLHHRVMHSKIADGTANSVDPDLGLHFLPRPICPKT